MAYGDPVDPTDPTAGYGGGGLLGNLSGNPLFNFGVGLLSKVGPSLTPQSGIGNIGGALQYASAAQQEAAKNQLIRQKLAESASQSAAMGQVEKMVLSGDIAAPAGFTPEGFAAILRGNPDLAAKYIPQSLTPEAQAQLQAGYPAVAKAQLDLQQANELRGFEKVTSNTTVKNAVEAEGIISRLEKGPVPPGSSAASVVKTFSDPEGYIPVTVPAATIAKTIAAATGKPMSEADAKQFATDWNRLIKLQSKFITDQRNLQQQQQANASTGGRTTDFGLSFIEKQNVSPFVPGDANRLILRDLIQKQKEMAGVRGWELPDIAEGDKLLKNYETQLAPVEPGTPDPAGTPSTGGGIAGAAGAAYNSLFGTAPVQPPVGAGPPMLPGSPAASLGVQNGGLVPQPAAAPVTTTPQPGVPAKTGAFPQAINPRTQQAERVWPRPADGEREIKKQLGPDAIGRTYIAVNPQTKRPQLYTITENNKGTLR